MIDLDGAYDLHVHSSPDLFPRIADDRQMVADAAARGFGGGFAPQSSGLETQSEGLSILTGGRLIPEAREVMALVKQHGAALATGHVAFKEIAALVVEAEAQGFRKLILTHPYDRAPGLTFEQVRALARPPVRIEFVFCSITPNWAFTDAPTIAHCIRR